MPDPVRLNELPEWAALAKHRAELGGTHLRQLFGTDPGRAGRLTLRAGDPLDGEVLAAFDCPGGPRYEQREVTAPLIVPPSEPRLTDLYLVWDCPGIVAGTLIFQ